jgi:predicted alpha/beta superfamily hydrolase
MFDHYVLGSPSLWFGQRHLFGVESAYAARKQDLPARVLLMTGGYETLRPQSRNPRYN